MPRALVQTGMELEYDTFGSPLDPALLLIMGFTAQMTAWDVRFCQILADGGHFVIRFDNRDSGLSTKLDGQVPDVAGAMAAALADTPAPPLPYLLGDMAADAMGLLDVLGIERAHIMGASMGGMIAQVVAINHPERVISLISVMSQPGEIEVGQPSDEAAMAIFSPPPTTREEYIEASPRWLVWASKKYRDVARTKELAAREFDRSFYPEGAPRQMAAIYGSGRRSVQLQALDVPTLVIHGRDDQLIMPSGGFRTAELIPGAHLLFVADMGHDLPEPLWPLLTDAVLSHTRRA
ncbi:MAG TPA: alpha/beta hydrolase [Ilumatobacteraceae bacterium]|nr:alpha/beta hydrolase [Ilumatobacteraceae bacterium]HQY15352.1 alpha/beta hydrolase [Ilumatobacteraceae bacterium]HRA85227.1 alpha/beta hydrolase [Ilumatobacteraceae bacterium]HRC47198.1 alpha/beta hydrolase [Ilumatobacteraceae bacterium]